MTLRTCTCHLYLSTDPRVQSRIPEARPHLIIVPNSTLHNWHREISKWAPNLEILLYHGSQADRAEMRDTHDPKRVMQREGRAGLPHIVLSVYTYVRCVWGVWDVWDVRDVGRGKHAFLHDC